MQSKSATIGPSVARVSAPNTTPSLNIVPTIVVPVFLYLCFKFVFNDLGFYGL